MQYYNVILLVYCPKLSRGNIGPSTSWKHWYCDFSVHYKTLEHLTASQYICNNQNQFRFSHIHSTSLNKKYKSPRFLHSFIMPSFVMTSPMWKAVATENMTSILSSLSTSTRRTHDSDPTHDSIKCQSSNLATLCIFHLLSKKMALCDVLCYMI